MSASGLGLASALWEQPSPCMALQCLCLHWTLRREANPTEAVIYLERWRRQGQS